MRTDGSSTFAPKTIPWSELTGKKARAKTNFTPAEMKRREEQRQWWAETRRQEDARKKVAEEREKAQEAIRLQNKAILEKFAKAANAKARREAKKIASGLRHSEDQWREDKAKALLAVDMLEEHRRREREALMRDANVGATTPSTPDLSNT